MRRGVPRSRAIFGAGLAGGLFALFLVPPAQAFDHQAIARRALERHIRPGYERFANAAANLERETQALCARPAPSALPRVRTAFRQALLAWGGVEHLTFGPIAEEQRQDRLVFWPDRKGLGRRQVEKVLAGSDGQTLSAENLAKTSVAVQGFTAFDIVGFGPGSDALADSASPNSARCRYADAIAANISRIAREVRGAWTGDAGFARIWLEPGGGNAVFLDALEPTRALVRAFIDGLERTRDVRLAGPLGFKDRSLRPLDPPFPHSHLAVPLIAANVEGISALLTESGFLDKALIASPAADADEMSSILETVAGELERAAQSLEAAARLSPKPFENARAREKLVAAGFPLNNARATGGAYLSQAAGLGIGFNAGDGD